MELKGQAKLIRILVGEADKVGHVPLYEAIVKAAREAGLAGATVIRGILGFGPTSRIRSAKILDLSTDLPMVIELVDDEGAINGFLPVVHRLFDEADSGGLVTIESVTIIKYVHSERKSRGGRGTVP